MPRYFFDTYDGDVLVPDDVGQELENLEAAKAVAQEELPLMAQDELPDGDERTFIVSVRDEAGHVVLRAALSLIVEYPSVRADRPQR
ncbi:MULTISPECIES: DUF6894 family protein [Microvirga]|uniref:DUF6894 family protein n=1 Tax=Microvirga TaxID=186650 RepID=UPI0021C8AB83|nr:MULTISPECIES: hypothetical protein [unclassified Microvirga]